MRANDLLVFFTDGLYEVEGAGDVFFHQQKLTELISRLMNQDAATLFDRLQWKLEGCVRLVGSEIPRLDA